MVTALKRNESRKPADSTGTNVSTETEKVHEGEIIPPGSDLQVTSSLFSSDPKEEKESRNAGLKLIDEAGKAAEMALSAAQKAGAHGVIHAAIFGDCSLLSRLYVRLMESKNHAMAASFTYFLRRVNAAYRQDGEPVGEDNNGNTIWNPKPTRIFEFLLTPVDKNGNGTTDHVNWNKKGRGDKADAHIKNIVRKAREQMIQDGKEAIAAISWMSEKEAKGLTREPDDKAFESRLERLLIGWASLPKTEYAKSTLISIARVAGLKIEDRISSAFDEHHKPANSNDSNQDELLKGQANETEEKRTGTNG